MNANLNVPGSSVLGIAVASCRNEPARSPEVPAAVVADTALYSRDKVVDLTGDGRMDTVRIVATGSRMDSLDIVLTLIVDGKPKHRSEWGSSYELALADSGTITDTARVIRAKLDSVLSSVRMESFGDPSVRVTAEDSATLAGINPRPRERVSFSYGYETTVRLVWDATKGEFVELFTCC